MDHIKNALAKNKNPQKIDKNPIKNKIPPTFFPQIIQKLPEQFGVFYEFFRRKRVGPFFVFFSI
jgi:hypothetical protein